MDGYIFYKYGYECTKNNVHISEYKKGNVIVYNVPVNKSNIVIHPKNERLIKGKIIYRIYHNSNMTFFPKKIHNGENSIHYGLRIDFESEKELEYFLKKYDELLTNYRADSDSQDTIPTVDLKLSNRSKNALLRAGILSLNDLMEKEEDDIFSIKNIGANSLEEIMHLKNLYKKNGEKSEVIQQNSILINEDDSKLVIQEAVPELLNEKIERVSYRNKKGILVPDINIQDIGFSVRTQNGLLRGGYFSINQVSFIRLNELYDIRNLGAKSFSEIIEYLKNNTEVIKTSDEINRDYRIKKIYNFILQKIDKDNYIVSQITDLMKNNIVAKKEEIKLLLKTYNYEEIIYCKEFRSLVYDSEQIYRLYDEYVFDLISNHIYEEVMTKNNFFVRAKINNKSIQRLLKNQRIELVNGKYRNRLPYIEDWINSISNEKDAAILKMRLEGKTLEECGKKMGVTRERIRQVVLRLFRNKPILREDDYKYWFEKYMFNIDSFSNIFLTTSKEYNYLSLAYKSGFRNLDEIVEDERITPEIEKAFYKFKYKNKIYVFDEYIDCNKAKLCQKLGKHYCSDREITVEEFYKLYNDFLITEKLDNKKLLFSSDRAFGARIDDSRFFVSKYGRKIRFYPIDEIDICEMVKNLHFEVFNDIELSTLKIFRDNKETMLEYDIRDEYELHNILKKTELQWKKGNLINVTLNRMPYISFGNASREKQTVDFLYKVAPVSIEEFCELYESEFGVLAQTAMANFLPYISNYYHNGICSINQPLLDAEEKRYLQNHLLEDFYFIEDIREKFTNKYGLKNGNKINARTLKELGFRLYADYVVSSEYSSAGAYFKELFTKDDFFDFRTLDKRMIYLNFVNSTLDDLRSSYELLEYEDMKFIKLSRIQRVYPNVNKKMINEYVDLAIKYLPDEKFFTVRKLKNSGFHHYLQDIGLDEWFNSGLIKNSKKIRFVKTGGNVVFSKEENQITTKDFIEYLLKRLKKSNIYEFLKYLADEYGVIFSKEQINQFIKSTDMYYDSIMEKIYLSKEYYYEEI